MTFGQQINQSVVLLSEGLAGFVKNVIFSVEMIQNAEIKFLEIQGENPVCFKTFSWGRII